MSRVQYVRGSNMSGVQYVRGSSMIGGALWYPIAIDVKGREKKILASNDKGVDC